MGWPEALWDELKRYGMAWSVMGWLEALWDDLKRYGMTWSVMGWTEALWIRKRGPSVVRAELVAIW